MRDETRSNWRRAILICGKCTRKLRGGFGKHGRTPLAKALRKFVKAGRGRKADLGIVETECLKVCPKGRVVAIRSRRPDQWLLIQPGTPIEQIAARLHVPDDVGLSSPCHQQAPSAKDHDLAVPDEPALGSRDAPSK